MDMLTTAVKAPAHVAERPFALANQAAKRILGTPDDEKGPLDHLFGFIGGQRVFGSQTFGQTVDGIAHVIGQPGAFANSWIMSHHANRAREIWNKRDDEPVGQGTLSFITVGEYKEDLRKMGITDQVAADLVSGKVSAWEVGDISSPFQDNPIADFGYRAVIDPVNLVFFGGPAIVRVGGKAAQGAWAMLKPSVAGRMTRGAGYIQDMVGLGLRAPKLGSPRTAAAEILRGESKGASLKGLAQVWDAAARGAGHMRMIASSANRTAIKGYKIGLATEAGVIGSQVAAGSVDKVAEFTLGENNVVSGIMQGWLDFANDVQNDHPISDNMLAVMVTAFHMPASGLGREVVGGVRGRIRAFQGDDFEAVMARELGVGSTPAERLTEFREYITSTSKAMGLTYEEGLAYFRSHIDMHSTLERLVDEAPVLMDPQANTGQTLAASFDDLAYRGKFLHDWVYGIKEKMIAKGQIKSTARVDTLKRWHANQFGADVTALDFPWDAQLARRTFFEQFLPAQLTTAPVLNKLGAAVIGRAKVITKESMTDLIRVLELAAKDHGGWVPLGEVYDAMRRFPGLLEHDTTGIFERLMTLRGGGAKREVHIDELKPSLEELRTNAPAQQELFHEARRAERDAPADQVQDFDGVIVRDAVRKIHSQKDLEKFRHREVDMAGEDMRQVIAEQKRSLRSDFSSPGKRRKPKPPSMRRMAQVDDLYAQTIRDTGATWNPRTGAYYKLQDGFIVGQHHATFREVPVDNQAAFRKAVADVQKAYPDAYVGTWVNEGVIHVDPSVVLMDIGEAMTAAFLKKQKAIWDAKRGVEINVPINEADLPVAISELRLQMGMPDTITGTVPAPRSFDLSEPDALYNMLSARVPAKGNPGYTLEEGVMNAQSLYMVFRDEAGDVAGILEMQRGAKPGQVEQVNVAVRSKNQGQGIGKDLFAQARRLGYDVEAASGRGTLTESGAALKAAREREALVEYETRAAQIAEQQAKLDDATALSRELDKRAEELRTVRLDPRFKLDEMPPQMAQRLRELESRLREDYPMYTLEPAPVNALRLYPEDGVLPSMVLERNAVARFLSEYGPASKISMMWDNLFGPTPNSKMAHASRQEIYDHLIPEGFTPKQIDFFLERLRGDVERHRIGLLEYPMYRGINSLPKRTIESIAAELFSPEQFARVTEKFGSFQEVLARSSNSFVRRVEHMVLRGERVGLADRLAKGVYDGWGNVPGLSSGTRVLSKTLYPLFRFASDIRYHLMNMLEADMIALGRDGLRATRFGGEAGALARRASRIHAKKYMGANPLDDADTTGFLWGRLYDERVAKMFEVERLDSVTDVVRSLGDDSPIKRDILERFPELKTDRDIAELLDEQLYRGLNDDKMGALEGVLGEADRLLNQAEMVEIAPLLQRIAEVNQNTYDDIVKVLIGNVNRSRMERLLNSYWLYWPLSYQIKATRWLFDVMTRRMGGRQTNLGGAFMVERMHQLHLQQLQNNPEYAEELEKHPTLWFAAQMLFPITPLDIGVSLSRPARYVGSWVGFWPEYAKASNPGEAAVAILEMGPIYTAELLARINQEFDSGDQSSDAEYQRLLPVRR
jgi:hypothetical protein